MLVQHFNALDHFTLDFSLFIDPVRIFRSGLPFFFHPFFLLPHTPSPPSSPSTYLPHSSLSFYLKLKKNKEKNWGKIKIKIKSFFFPFFLFFFLPERRDHKYRNNVKGFSLIPPLLLPPSPLVFFFLLLLLLFLY